MPTRQETTEVQRIRRAFACCLPLDHFSDEEYKELKWEIAKLTFEDVVKWLPLLLIHEIESAEASNGDALVYLLDGNLRGRQTEEVKRRRASMREVLDRFSKQQAEAVRLWLKRVAKRKYGRLCSDDIDSAISYWADREAALKLTK